jgi:hypothetical protein
MTQFYEIYRNDQIVAPLVRQFPWSHHLQILGQCKLPEEREFYLRMAVQEGWSKRQLERQIRAALFERVVLSPPSTSASSRCSPICVQSDQFNVKGQNAEGGTPQNRERRRNSQDQTF